jgi:hypothetical protein
VLDLEIDGDVSANLAARFAQQSAQRSTQPASLVMLGSVRRGQIPDGEYIAKPYHYGPLIRRIEELLIEQSEHIEQAGQTEQASCRRSSSSAETTRERALS